MFVDRQGICLNQILGEFPVHRIDLPLCLFDLRHDRLILRKANFAGTLHISERELAHCRNLVRECSDRNGRLLKDTRIQTRYKFLFLLHIRKRFALLFRNQNAGERDQLLAEGEEQYSHDELKACVEQRNLHGAYMIVRKCRLHRKEHNAEHRKENRTDHVEGKVHDRRTARIARTAD